MKVFNGYFLLLLACALAVSEASHRQCPTGRKDCICTFQLDPVCSTIGCTYSNHCVLACAGQKLWYRGECRKQRPSYYG